MTPSCSIRPKTRHPSSEGAGDALSKVVGSLVTSLEVLQTQNLGQNKLNAEMHAETRRNQHDFQMMMLKMMSLLQPSLIASLQPSQMAPPSLMLAYRPRGSTNSVGSGQSAPMCASVDSFLNSRGRVPPLEPQDPTPDENSMGLSSSPARHDPSLSTDDLMFDVEGDSE